MSSTLVTRFQQLGVVRLIKTKAGSCFSKYLLVTNTGISVLMSGTGDLLQQYYEVMQKRQTHWNATRSRHMCVSGIALGVLSHYWYIALDRMLPGRTFRVVVKKVILDQLVCSPLLISAFLISLGIQEKASGHAMMCEIRQKGPVLWLAECLVWPPAQAINFYVLPTRFRVLYDNMVSLGMDCYYPYVKYRKLPNSDKTPPGAEDTGLRTCEDETKEENSKNLTCDSTVTCHEKDS